MKRFTSSRVGAFTLVELLVVIGIIAVLIGVLLPVLSGAQRRGRDLKCQANMRSMLQALHNYVAENKGSMPYGFYYNRSLEWPAGRWTNAGPDNTYISWVHQLGKYMVKSGDGMSTSGSRTRSPVQRCPEAEQSLNHLVSYIGNIIVFISPFDELRVGEPPRAQLRPPRINQMLKETCVLWDTAIRPDWQNIVGYLISADLDMQQRFWDGAATPQYRYYNIKDTFANFPGSFGQNQPVHLTWPSYPFFNKDPKTHSQETFPYQGNLRFRHAKNTVCVAGFADGSVRLFTAKLNPNNTVKSHDALRRYFMIKWPVGVPPDPGVPN